MPTFPNYEGTPLPTKLNPTKLFDWYRLFMWVYDDSTNLKHFLHSSDPELYGEVGREAFFKSLQNQSYRSLIVISILQMSLLPIVVWIIFSIGNMVYPINFDTTNLFSKTILFILFGAFYELLLCFVAGTYFGVFFGITFGSLLSISPFAAFIYSLFPAKDFSLSNFNMLLLLLAAVSTMASFLNTDDNNSTDILQIPALLISNLVKSSYLRGTDSFLQLKSVREVQFQLKQHPDQAIKILRSHLQNTGSYHTAMRLCNEVLKRESDPISCLYAWLYSPYMNEYAVLPVTQRQFQQIPSLRRALLGGLSNVFVNRTGNVFFASGNNNSSWRIGNNFFHSKATHSITLLTSLLLDLDMINDNQIDSRQYLLSAWQKLKRIHMISELPHCNEIAATFGLLFDAYRLSNIKEIASFQPQLAACKVNFPNPLRFDVVEILAGLADIAYEIVDYTQYSNIGAQGAALNRSLSMLNELMIHAEKIHLPEQALIELVISRWRNGIAQEAGKVGDIALHEVGIYKNFIDEKVFVDGKPRHSTLWKRPSTPFINPYILGRPVSGSIFVGRDDILNQIVKRWHSNHTPDSVILYGHRRMGKTSIVQNLAAHAPTGSLLAYLDLAGATATVEKNSDLILDIAEKIYLVASKQHSDLPQPQYEAYQQSKNADLHFQRLLRAILEGLPVGAFLILAFDEFEALEQAVEQGRLEKSVYGYLRMLSQQPRITLVLAGLHTLDEMSRDYQQAFFSSYYNVHVSYLSVQEAERLIARPTTNFTLNYERSVIDEIYRLTIGQPLLIQSICSALVNHLNHELFDLELERDARILPTDLESVITDDFLRREVRYFEGIWRDQLADYPDQQALLYILASQTAPLTTELLIASSKLTSEQVKTALQSLAKRDVIVEENETLRLSMPLFQRWLQLQMKEGKES